MSRMNAGIILSGAQPDFVNALAQSTQAARLANANQRDIQRNALFQQHGPGIVAGDRNAINALAQFDAPQALQVQQAKRQEERLDRRAEMSEQEFAFKIQQWATQATAAEAEKEAEDYKRLVLSASTAQTPEEWDRIVTEMGGEDAPDLVGQFQNREALLGKYMTAAQIIEQTKPPAPLSAQGKLTADLEAGRITPEQFEAANQKPGTRISSDGEGGITVEQGVGVTNKVPPKLTVDAAKNTGFLIRTLESNQVLDEMEDQGLRFGQQVLEHVPLGLGNFGRDPEFQRFDQARRDFVNSILRRESGAVISDQEFENANKQYFPVPGDKPEVIAQKRRNRAAAIEGLRVGSGAGAAFVEQQGDGAESVIPDFRSMSDEDLDAWILQNGGQQ